MIKEGEILGSTRKDILRIAIPSMGSSIFEMLYSFADLAWIGRLGKDAVASVTLAVSLYNMNYILNEIIGVSSVVLLSRSWGKRDLKSFENIGRQIVIYKFLAGLFLLILTYPLSPFLLSWLGSGKVPPSDAISYYRIMVLFLPFFFLMGTMATTFRSIGDTKTLFYVMAFGSISNIFLDPIFIFTLKMGVSGSALASGICSTASMMLGFFLAKKRWNVWLLKYAKLDLDILKKILKIGGPSLIDSVNWNLTRIATVKIFSMYGILATATFGIFSRTIEMAWMIGFALEGAITTLVGQSLGRRDSSKALEVFSEGLKVSVLIGAIVSIAVFIFSEPIAFLFSKDPQLVKSASEFLRYTSFGFFFMYMMNISYGTLIGGGRTIDTMFIGLLGNWSFRIPAMFVMKSLNFGYNALGIVIALSIAFESFIGLFMVKKKKWLKFEI